MPEQITETVTRIGTDGTETPIKIAPGQRGFDAFEAAVQGEPGTVFRFSGVMPCGYEIEQEKIKVGGGIAHLRDAIDILKQRHPDRFAPLDFWDVSPIVASNGQIGGMQALITLNWGQKVREPS